MPWYGWIILGAALLGTEMFVIDAQFYLVFFGFSALVVGVLGLAGIVLPAWAQWLTMGLLAALLMVTFRKRLYERVRRVEGTVAERVAAGDRIRMNTRLAPGESGKVEFRGTSWSAINEDARPLELGEEAEIIGMDGLTLRLRKQGLGPGT
ncbi:MAG TPA: NfeD family protein [Steroidobacteraceae bacterium]|nr:NfeD family protein [Steroidobacteraceae bacterium]